MTRSLVLAAALALPASSAAVSAPAAADPAAQARALYDSGRFQDAAAAYESMAAAAPRDAALQYDLGNALFKSGRLGRATAACASP